MDGINCIPARQIWIYLRVPYIVVNTVQDPSEFGMMHMKGMLESKTEV